MPSYAINRDAFVAHIMHRRRWAYRWQRAMRAITPPRTFLQAAVYDAVFRSDREAVAYYYALFNDHMPDLDNPVLINEKIRWQFLHHRNPLMTIAADKIGVRDYLRYKKAKIEAPELIAVGLEPDALLHASLPPSFVMKSAYGSGQMHVEASNDATPRAELAAKAKAWTEWDQWRLTGELHYRDVPKRWMIEEFVPASRRKLEYKVFCIHGEPLFVSVITERNGEDYERALFDLDWKPIDLTTRGVANDPRPLPRPEELDLILDEARRMSEDFMHVRVDFLKFDDRLLFSELTFASLAARVPFEPVEQNATIGAMMDLRRAPEYLARGEQTALALGWEGAQAVA